MEISANFAFLKQEFPHAAESASYAERHVYGDPRASCFHARHALERLVKRVYKVDKTLNPPKVTNLDAYLSEPAFRALVPEVVWQKAEYIRQAGNVAVHGNKAPAPELALNVVRELAHILYWAGRTYLRKGAQSLHGKTFDESLVPSLEPGAAPASVEELDALKRDLDSAEDARKEVEDELEALRERLAAIKAENETVPETRDWNESTTRRLIIDLALQRAGWLLGQQCVREYKVTGMPSASGVGYADYVLWGDDGKPLAVVEAKKTTVDPATGRQQAKLYADCLEAMHGQRPIIFYTNGYETYLWDDQAYAPRAVAGFHKKDELASLLHRRVHREPLDVARVKNAIVERYYQKRAIGSIGEQFSQARRKALLVMATGSGKTRVAVALVDLLQRAGWVKRALFLADRVSLVNQAVGAFKAHLPESSPVNLVTEKDKAGRVYVCTYPTMMGLINETTGTEARFGVGHFDLVIIDEAHRSVYQKYGAIFRYFDSLLVGLTATPRDQVDRNTYELFDLEPGVPTDVYELATAVADGFLVPPRVQQVDLRFPREGIDYDSLSEEEQAQWESLDWGDDEDDRGLPERVNASAINSWLFNNDTVDKVLQHLMEHGHTVDGGDRLAKTIIFARNHEHATFIEARFNHHYPRYAGHFARIIDHYATYPQSLLDDFSRKDKAPHVAISVDMLDTGIDVPEVANLVFFKPVYSRIKFWQMIGRGTRLCPDLFGPGDDKHDFRVFDFCFNFDFFGEHPEGIEDSGGVSLRARLFRSRVRLLSDVQSMPDLDPEAALAGALTTELHGEVAAMNRENFIVRMQLEAVERFRQRASWERLTASDVETLQSEVAGLPSESETDDIESRLFDLTGADDATGPRRGRRGHIRAAPPTGGGDRLAARRKDHNSRGDGTTRLPGLGAGERLLGRHRLEWSRGAAHAPARPGALPRQEDAHGRLHRLQRRDHGRARGRRRLPAEDDRGPVREEGAGVPEEPSRPHRDPPPPDQPAAHGYRPAGARTDAGRDRRGRRPDAVDEPPGAQRRALTGPFRAEPGGDGPRRRAGGLLGVPLQPKPDHAADPFHRDGDRPTHGTGCHGAVRALRGAVQQRARRRSRGVVRRQEQRHRGDLREVESPSPRTSGRRRLREPVSEVAESLWMAEAESSSHRQNEHAALAGDSAKAVPAGTGRQVLRRAARGLRARPGARQQRLRRGRLPA